MHFDRSGTETEVISDRLVRQPGHQPRQYFILSIREVSEAYSRYLRIVISRRTNGGQTVLCQPNTLEDRLAPKRFLHEIDGTRLHRLDSGVNLSRPGNHDYGKPQFSFSQPTLHF